MATAGRPHVEGARHRRAVPARAIGRAAPLARRSARSCYFTIVTGVITTDGTATEDSTAEFLRGFMQDLHTFSHSAYIRYCHVIRNSAARKLGRISYAPDASLYRRSSLSSSLLRQCVTCGDELSNQMASLLGRKVIAPFDPLHFVSKVVILDRVSKPTRIVADFGGETSMSARLCLLLSDRKRRGSAPASCAGCPAHERRSSDSACCLQRTSEGDEFAPPVPAAAASKRASHCRGRTRRRLCPPRFPDLLAMSSVGLPHGHRCRVFFPANARSRSTTSIGASTAGAT